MKILVSGIQGLDTETTGINPEQDRIVTATVAHLLSDGPLQRHQSWLINPGVKIPHAAFQVYGILH